VGDKGANCTTVQPRLLLTMPEAQADRVVNKGKATAKAWGKAMDKTTAKVRAKGVDRDAAKAGVVRRVRAKPLLLRLLNNRTEQVIFRRPRCEPGPSCVLG
jgi:hypothetical protein